MILALLAAALPAQVAIAVPANPTADELCGIYRKAARKKLKGDPFAARIVAACDQYSVDSVRGPERPAFNFRAVTPRGEGEGACRLFRSGQPAPAKVPEDAPSPYAGNLLGFDLAAASRTLGIGTVIGLRFDPTYKTFVETFGPGAPRLPVSAGEVAYRYAAEKALVEAAGMRSVYAPTLPEMEHFIGHYVPRLDRGPGSKPYVCRLPSGVPDGAEPHWLNEHPQAPETIAALEQKGERPLLASAFEDCRDVAAAYGPQQAAEWLAEVNKTSVLANELFIRIADRAREGASRGRKVLFHCAGGTDRAGRVAMIVELREYGVSRDRVRAYQGPLSDPAIDLIAVNYLLSQRAGTKPEYRYLFPDPARPERSWLYLGLGEVHRSVRFPVLEDWHD